MTASSNAAAETAPDLLTLIGVGMSVIACTGGLTTLVASVVVLLIL